ncbi:MAG: VOC family protein [Pedobacter sp.]|nr:MAG: VOC family protein [Pedobacter sp.]
MKDYDNFFLPADELDSAKDFYQKKLGLELKFDFSDKGMVAFKVGDNEAAIILSTKKNARPAIWLTVEDVRQAYQELTQEGIRFTSEPYEIMTGLCVEFTDPFGNTLGLTDYTKMPQLEGGKTQQRA